MSFYALAVGDSGADRFTFNDGSNVIHGEGADGVPVGISFEYTETGLVVTVGVVCYQAAAPSRVAAERTFRALDDKCRQAKQAAAEQGRRIGVSFLYQPDGAALSYFDVLDAELQHIPQPWLEERYPLKAGALKLTCAPYMRTAAVIDPTTPTLIAGTATGYVYRHNVPGTAGARALIRLNDVSINSKIAQRVTLARKAVRGPLGTTGLLANDATPNLDVSANGAGISAADAGTPFGHRVRIAGSAAWQGITETLQPASGAYQRGLVDLIAIVRDSAAPLGKPNGGASAGASTGGALEPGYYSYVVTTHDGSGNESLIAVIPDAIVPITTVISGDFFDSFETGDRSQWDSLVQSLAGTAQQASIVPLTDAASPLGLTSVYGVRCIAANGGQVTLRKAQPRSSNTSTLQYDFRINQNSGGASSTVWTGIPVIPGVLMLQDQGTGFDVYGSTTGGTSWTKIGTGHAYLPEQQWNRLEVVAAWNGSSQYTVSVYVNASLIFGPSASGAGFVTGPTPLAIGAMTSGATTLSIDVDNVQISTTHIGANAGSAALAWAAPVAGSAGTGYYVRWQKNGGGWRKLDAGNVLSYSHTSMTAGSPDAGPPTGVPVAAHNLFRALIGTQGGTFVPLAPVAAVVSNGQYEALNLGTAPLPPAMPPDGGTPPPWAIRVQGKLASSGAANLDVAGLILLPHGDQVVLTAQTPLTSKAIWQAALRADGRVSGILFSAASPTTVLDIPDVRGRFTLGAGDNIIVPLVEAGDGSGNFVFDGANTQFTVDDSVSPLWDAPPGQTPFALSYAGNVLDDDRRWRGLQSDGNPYPQRTTWVLAGSGAYGDGRIQIPLTSLTLPTVQGWFAIRLVAGFANTDTFNHWAFTVYKDANNWLGAWFDSTTGHWKFTTVDAGNFVTADAGASIFGAGGTLLLIGRYTATAAAISLNCGGFVSHPGRLSQFTGQVVQDIGSLNGVSLLNGQVQWALGGTGALTDFDAGTLAANGATKPPFGLLPVAAGQVFSWWADSNQANEG